MKVSVLIALLATCEAVQIKSNDKQSKMLTTSSKVQTKTLSMKARK